MDRKDTSSSGTMKAAAPATQREARRRQWPGSAQQQQQQQQLAGKCMQALHMHAQGAQGAQGRHVRNAFGFTFAGRRGQTLEVRGGGGGAGLGWGSRHPLGPRPQCRLGALGRSGFDVRTTLLYPRNSLGLALRWRNGGQLKRSAAPRRDAPRRGKGVIKVADLAVRGPRAGTPAVISPLVVAPLLLPRAPCPGRRVRLRAVRRRTRGARGLAGGGVRGGATACGPGWTPRRRKERGRQRPSGKRR